MTIVAVRRISQCFFLVLFLWFCAVTTLGDQWWQLRGWPVNWFIQLDPLVGLATLLTTYKIYAGLIWGLATAALTIILGRFFCAWVCPFGSIHHFTGWLSHRNKTTAEKVNINRYRKAQSIKYWLLAFLLMGAATHIISLPSDVMESSPWIFWIILFFILVLIGLLALLESLKGLKKALTALLIFSAELVSAFYGRYRRAFPAGFLPRLEGGVQKRHNFRVIVYLPDKLRIDNLVKPAHGVFPAEIAKTGIRLGGAPAAAESFKKAFPAFGYVIHGPAVYMLQDGAHVNDLSQRFINKKVTDAELFAERNFHLRLRCAKVKEHERTVRGMTGIDGKVDSAGHRCGAKRKRLSGT